MQGWSCWQRRSRTSLLATVSVVSVQEVVVKRQGSNTKATARRGLRPTCAEERHFAAGHVPRRMWCPICARASLEEDPHQRGQEDHFDTGLATVS